MDIELIVPRQIVEVGQGELKGIRLDDRPHLGSVVFGCDDLHVFVSGSDVSVEVWDVAASG